ncbi:hypothetical protein [Nonomuraea africana]|uniref:hypothetical protein n=1 Tax=Nonomuraea africana TaxID=46171 RepID=UPI0033C53883
MRADDGDPVSSSGGGSHSWSAGDRLGSGTGWPAAYRARTVSRCLPRCAESQRLRPITTAVNLQVPFGSPEQQAIEDWLRYGAPFHDVPG